MKRAIVFVYEAAHFTELIRVGRVLRDAGGWSIDMFFVRDYPMTARDARTAHDEGMGVLLRGAVEPPTAPSPSPAPAATAAGSRPFSGARRVIAHLRKNRAVNKTLSSFPVRLIGEFDAVRNAKSAGRALVDSREPDLFVFAEENGAYDEFGPPMMIRIGRLRGVASLVVPYTIADASEIAEQLFPWPNQWVRGIPGRMAACLAPEWTIEHRGRRLLRLPAEKVIARHVTGTGSSRPWSFYAGEADAMAVESQQMLDYWRDEGVPEHILSLTGALYDDVLARGLERRGSGRRELERELGLAPDRPLVLCAIPPAAPLRIPKPFLDYAAVVRFWARTLLEAYPNANVVFRLHPSGSREEFRENAPAGACLSDRDTAALVPLADLYVASISATIRWAIACGVPVLNYDVYQFGYRDYDSAPGVVTVDSAEDFRREVALLAPGGPKLTETAARQKSVAGRWGNLDGKAAERMLKLINRIVSAQRETIGT